MEEVQEVPKWLKELEDKRERRLKARLGHEAGAGSPCLTCEDKCPGLDLHFWRKICKNCKCGKENHDVNDDDIYGWAQFQLLGSKPSKNKKIVLPGRKDAVELDWTPKGHSDTVDLYLKELPVNLLPIKGSTAAQERKQLLQKQIPLHDIDPTLCHALSENEIKQMNDYIAHVKQSSVGIGHIMKLNELLKNRQSLNTQYQLNRTPMQLSQSQHIVLQGSDRANMLKNEYDTLKNLNQLTLANLMENSPKDSMTISVDNQNPSRVSDIRDIHYDPGSNYNPASRTDRVTSKQNVIHPIDHHNLHVDTQNAITVNPPKNLRAEVSAHNDPQARNINFPDQRPHDRILHPPSLNTLYPNSPYSNQLDNQPLYYVKPPKDIHLKPTEENLYPLQFSHVIDHTPVNKFTSNRDRRQPASSLEFSHDANNTHPMTVPGIDNTTDKFISDYQPRQIYPNQNVNTSANITDNQTPLNLRNTDIHSKLYHNVPTLDNSTDCQKSAVTEIYPDQNVNFKIGDLKANPELLGISNMPHYASTKFNTVTDQQTPQKFTSIKDLAYSTYNPLTPKYYNPNQLHIDEENIQPTPVNPLTPKCYNPNQLHVGEENVQPTPVNPLTPKYYNPNQLHIDEENIQPTPVNPLTPKCYNPNQLYVGEENVQPTPVNPLTPKYNPNQLYTGEENVQPTPVNPLTPKCYNPNQFYVDEENVQPTPVNVGAINDIEYSNPLIKSAQQKQNEFLPDIPRKNVQFDLNDVQILPCCYKCKKMFSSDDFVIGIDRSDALWHSDCFRCTGCNQNLADLFYFYHKESNDIYCGRDYAKIRGIPRCQACDELIFVKEYCLAENSTFHVKHFCCYECDKPLAGQNYVMEELQPLCVPCFENVKAEKCKVCLQVIKPDEQGANLNGVHFHANDECFCCKMCKKPLLGAKLLFKNENLYCSSPCFGADK